MKRNYFLEGILVLLGLAAIATAIKYPRDVFITLPLEIIKTPLKKIWWIVSLPLIVLGIDLVYFGEKYKWKITPAISKLVDVWTGDSVDIPPDNLKQ